MCSNKQRCQRFNRYTNRFLDSNGEEEEVQATNIVLFLLESKLIEHGAKHEAAANWSNHVIVDGRLVAGQNPASAASVGEAISKLLK